MIYELGIIGAGNMAEAIARGVIAAGTLRPSQIIASDLNADRRELFEKSLSIHCVEHAVDAAKVSRCLLLSVKPQQMQEVLTSLAPSILEDCLAISIAAGISTTAIEKWLGDHGQRVIRVMPNTPMLVGAGMAAIAAGTFATADDLAFARKLFSASADVIEVREDQIDAVTAVSGSGPAYFFFLVEQMIAAGVELGLSPEQAHRLATRTAAGAAKMLVESADTPADLRRKVTSPGGTTHAAITTMQERGVDAGIIAALKAAAARGKELGK